MITADSTPPLSYDEAFLYCLTLTHDNKKDWMMPLMLNYKDPGWRLHDVRRQKHHSRHPVTPVRYADESSCT